MSNIQNDNRQGGNSAIQVFGNHFLSALGITSMRIAEYLPSEFINYREERIIVEDLYRLEDDTLLHIEFQSISNPNDLIRLAEIDLLIYEKHEKAVQTVVVFGANVLGVEVNLDLGAFKYKITSVMLYEWNGDEIAVGLLGKVKQKFDLTDNELCILAMLPFMKTEGSLFQSIKESVEIANFLADEQKKDLVIRMMDVMAKKLLPNDQYEHIVQELMMRF